MASTVDSGQALTAMINVLTAYTSAVGVSTATFATSIAAQISADTGLTAYESKIATLVSSALASVTPSSSTAQLSFAIDSRTLYGAMTSILTAFSSASGVSTTVMATQLSSQITVDTGLTSVESGLVTLFTSAVGNTQPSSSAHSQV
jgi:hypothetical protein